MPMYKKSMVVLLIVIIVAIAGTYYSLYHEKGVALDVSGAQVEQSVDQSKIAVYVCGAVMRPGMVSLPADARVMDAVEACGGVLPTADISSVNMALPLKDGMQVKVTSVSEHGDKKQSETSSVADKASGKKQTAESEKININEATADELTKLPGVGKSTALRIIDYREKNGNFQEIEDLKKVKGIGKSKFKKLENFICV